MRKLGIGLMVGLLALSAALVGGCSTAGEPAAVSYVRGNSEGVLAASPAEVVAASRAVMKELGIYVTSEGGNEATARLRGRTRLDESVRIDVEQRAEQQSKVWVRVGILGDQAVSDEIFRRIAARVR